MERFIGTVDDYKGFSAEIIYDEESNTYHGAICKIRDFVNFEGNNLGDAIDNFYDAVDNYLDFCKEVGKEPERCVFETPYNGL